MSKNHRLRFIGLVVVVLTMLSLSVVAAQDSLDDQPLLKMLARIPNTSFSRTEIYFNDRKAVEVAYPPAKMPADWVEFKAMSDAKGEDATLLPVDIWWKVWRNQASALSAQYLGLAEKTPAVVGFDYFQIEQEMTYGTPPAQALQFAGSFDLDAIRTAFENRGYSQEDNAGMEFWCPEAGCSEGTATNLRERNPANPFGGQLGRSQPLIIADGTLISSPDETVMNDHLDVAAQKEQSLADLPQYRAAAAAMTADGSLMQAYFWDGELLAQMGLLSPTAIFGERATPELVKRMFEEMLKDFETLPQYQLLGFADVASDSEQIGEVVLVYTNEADAKTAADVLPKRIANYQSIAVKRPFTELLTERHVTAPTIKFVDFEGTYVVVVAFPTPKATVEQIQAFKVTNPDPPDVTAPGLIYRLLVDSAMRRDINWLNTVTRESLEAAAK